MATTEHHKSMKSPKPISGLIDKVINSTSRAKDYHGWRIVTLWPEIVGETLATKSRAVDFMDGVLIVEVEDSAWRQEISMQTSSIMNSIHEYPFGRVVKRIRLRGKTGTD
ncbi:MAG: DUF721 domain-containing protein [Candidatus Zixiibacteriota bacterium]|nr:MAG: DUF721 domain-containing protein [candidate division Zixibacteria bacterium]